ncbi:hypothetical protein Scep_007097 [Stephania cephalantha]|uniref:Uncharacterized protein n=1 Tax=Stephania cephalantha TaxID=152367 RepID=A0AAP0KAF9_9MAGN
MAASATRGYAEAADERRGSREVADELQAMAARSDGGDGRHLRGGGGEKQGRRREAMKRSDDLTSDATRRGATRGRSRGRAGKAVRQARAQRAVLADDAVERVEKRRGGALPDRLIPDEAQQQWSRRRDFDEARRRDGLLANETRGVGHVGPLANESWLLFICDMSSYLDAVDISQLSVRWGLLFGPYLIVAKVRAGRHVSRPEPESAGLLPRLNDLLVGTPCYLASLID